VQPFRDTQRLVDGSLEALHFLSEDEIFATGKRIIEACCCPADLGSRRLRVLFKAGPRNRRGIPYPSFNSTGNLALPQQFASRQVPR